MKKIKIYLLCGLGTLLGLASQANANFYVPTQKSTPCPTKRCSTSQPTQRCNTQAVATNSSWQCPTLSNQDITKNPIPCPTKRCTPMSISTEDKPPLLNRCLPYLSPRCNPPTQSKKIVVIIYEGSLKNNIERIAKQHGWCKVIWQAPADYHWVGTAKITGNSLPEVIELVLRPFPLEITFYQANRIAAVTPRKYYD